MVKVIFVLRTRGCCRNAVEICSAGAGQELLLLTGVAQCVTVSAAAFRGCKKEGALKNGTEVIVYSL